MGQGTGKSSSISTRNTKAGVQTCQFREKRDFSRFFYDFPLFFQAKRRIVETRSMCFHEDIQAGFEQSQNGFATSLWNFKASSLTFPLSHG